MGNESIYYDVKKTLRYNCLYNFILGNRSAGKTFSCKKWAIDDFLKNGKQWIYLRRYDTELKKVVNKLFDDIRFLYPEREIAVKGRSFYIDKEEMGQAMALSKAATYKSAPFPDVDKIIFDEFLIDNPIYKYLSDEITIFEGIYNTIARPGTDHPDVTVAFLANAVTVTNPYFLYYNLQLPKDGKKIWRNGEILLELYHNEEMVARQQNTRFASVASQKYKDYAFNNKFLLDDSVFIKKKSATANFQFSFVYKGERFGVWIDYKEGGYFVSKDYDPYNKIEYAITLSDHSPNRVLLKQISKSLMQRFIAAYKEGLVYFETMNIKNLTYEVIKLCLNR